MPVSVNRCCWGFSNGVCICPLGLQCASPLSPGRGKSTPDLWSPCGNACHPNHCEGLCSFSGTLECEVSIAITKYLSKATYREERSVLAHGFKDSSPQRVEELATLFLVLWQVARQNATVGSMVEDCCSPLRGWEAEGEERPWSHSFKGMPP
jgi:hypothetical protein